MAVGKGEIGIYGVLVNDTPDAIIAKAKQLFDDVQAKDQETINKDVKKALETILGDVTLSNHLQNYDNPHKVTKTQVGLSNVDNTSDANKPVSTSQQVAIDDAKKAGTDALNNLTVHIGNKNNPHNVTKAQLSLENVTNDAQVKRSEMGVPSGVATLDEYGKVPSAQLPSYVDDVLEFSNTEAFPNPGESNKIYVALDTNKTYRWGGTEYVEISKSLAIGDTSTSAFSGDRGVTLETKMNKVQGDASTEGSINKALADAKSYTDTKLTWTEV